MNNLLTISQAAAQLGIKPRRMQQMCQRGQVRHERIGRMILIKPRDLEPVRVRPGAGRPRKEPAGAVKEAEA